MNCVVDVNNVNLGTLGNIPIIKANTFSDDVNPNTTPFRKASLKVNNVSGALGCSSLIASNGSAWVIDAWCPLIVSAALHYTGSNTQKADIHIKVGQ